MTFLEFLAKFPTEDKVVNHWLTVRYPKGVRCNHCKSEKVYQYGKSPKFFQCNGCGNSFSVFTGTIFEGSSTDLRKWLYAVHLVLNGKKGISGLQLQREIGGSYKTSWRMLKQIRTAMGNRKTKKVFSAVVEMDDAYVGGKPKDEDDSKRGRGTGKKAIVGVLERDSNQVHAKVALPDEKGRRLTGKQLLAVLDEACGKEALVMTDEFKGYLPVGQGRIHLTVDHSKGWVNGDVHTNGIESFWATLKRGVYGVYHHVSVQHMQRYIDEFCFRHNNRENENAFDTLLGQAILD